jgi:hypothetical protein
MGGCQLGIKPKRREAAHTRSHRPTASTRRRHPLHRARAAHPPQLDCADERQAE